MKVVIIGGVAGGASAAARLRRLDEAVEIVLLERGAYISYANCGLPYYIGGKITGEENLTLQTPHSFRARFAVDVRVGHEAVEIHRERKTVSVRNRAGDALYEERYDKLLLAPGAEPVRPDLPGIDHPCVHTLRSIPDTLRIRSLVDQTPGGRALVAGGGYIGLEMAENLSRAGMAVTVAELADHVIAPLDYDMACDVHHHLRRREIDLRLGCGVTALHPCGDGVEAELSDGCRIPADLVLLSVGVRPDTDLARRAGLELGIRGSIRVDEHLRTSDPDIYAAGDAVEVTNLLSGRPAHIPLAGPANKQGRIAADNICGGDSVYRGSQGTCVLGLFDMTVAATGLNERAAEELGLEFDKAYTFSPSHATYYPGASSMSVKILFRRSDGLLLGAQLVGYDGVDKRCDVLATAIRGGMTVRDLTELELSYAPPFSSAKDPVNMAGYAAENLLEGRVRQVHWHDVPALLEQDAAFLDVRTPGEYTRGHLPGAIHIPLDDLRARLGELDSSRPLYVHCHSGLRSYVACRILLQSGFDARNLAGGWRLYQSVERDRAQSRRG